MCEQASDSGTQALIGAALRVDQRIAFAAGGSSNAAQKTSLTS
jgi:hypothetical protein